MKEFIITASDSIVIHNIDNSLSILESNTQCYLKSSCLALEFTSRNMPNKRAGYILFSLGDYVANNVRSVLELASAAVMMYQTQWPCLEKI